MSIFAVLNHQKSLENRLYGCHHGVTTYNLNNLFLKLFTTSDSHLHWLVHLMIGFSFERDRDSHSNIVFKADFLLINSLVHYIFN